MQEKQKEVPLDLWLYERRAAEGGRKVICGVDEAGAGPLAGDVFAAAVILPRGWTHPWLTDSKKVTPKRRELLFDEIQKVALHWGIGRCSPEEIDRLDILNCRMLAMNRAVEAMGVAPELALVDGNRNHGSRIALEFPNELVVKGDSLSASIAAASILAKVSRDREMVALAAAYPEYGFEKHKGYGTKAHYDALRQYGPCEIHRRTFLKKLGDQSMPKGE